MGNSNTAALDSNMVPRTCVPVCPEPPVCPESMYAVCNHNCVVQFVGVLFRPTPSVVTMFMENGSVEGLLVSGDSPAKKELVGRMAIEAAKGVIHLHRLGVGLYRLDVDTPIG